MQRIQVFDTNHSDGTDIYNHNSAQGGYTMPPKVKIHTISHRPNPHFYYLIFSFECLGHCERTNTSRTLFIFGLS